MTAVAKALVPSRTEEQEQIADHLARAVDVWIRPPRPSNPRAAFTPEEDRLDLIVRMVAAQVKLEHLEAATLRVEHLRRLLDGFLGRPEMEATMVRGADVAVVRAGWDVLLDALQAIQDIHAADYDALMPTETRAMWERVKGGAA